jgi:hypothetical protein
MHGSMSNAYKISDNLKNRNLLRKWEDNIRMDCKETGCDGVAFVIRLGLVMGSCLYGSEPSLLGSEKGLCSMQLILSELLSSRWKCFVILKNSECTVQFT